MRFIVLIVAAVLALSAAAQNPPAQKSGQTSLQQIVEEDPGVKKARTLLDQMIQALGGQAFLNVQDMKQQGRSYGFHHGEPQGSGALFTRFWKWPDKERFDFRASMTEYEILPGVDITSKANYSLVFSGDTGHEVTFRGTAALDPDVLQDYLRRRKHSLLWVLRSWLNEPEMIFLYQGQVVAERKLAEKVSILNAQNDAVTLYIDTTNHLPLKVTFVWRDPKTRDRDEFAVGYENYRPIQGIMTPFSVTLYKNGEPVNQRFLNTTTYNTGMTDAMFAATAIYEPKKK